MVWITLQLKQWDIVERDRKVSEHVIMFSDIIKTWNSSNLGLLSIHIKHVFW